MKREDFLKIRKNVFTDINDIPKDIVSQKKYLKIGIDGELERCRGYSDKDTIFIIIDKYQDIQRIYYQLQELLLNPLGISYEINRIGMVIRLNTKAQITYNERIYK